MTKLNEDSQAYKDGGQARLDGVVITENPYTEKYESHEWVTGWLDKEMFLTGQLKDLAGVSVAKLRLEAYMKGWVVEWSGVYCKTLTLVPMYHPRWQKQFLGSVDFPVRAVLTDLTRVDNYLKFYARPKCDEDQLAKWRHIYKIQKESRLVISDFATEFGLGAVDGFALKIILGGVDPEEVLKDFVKNQKS